MTSIHFNHNRGDNGKLDVTIGEFDSEYNNGEFEVTIQNTPKHLKRLSIYKRKFTFQIH